MMTNIFKLSLDELITYKMHKRKIAFKNRVPLKGLIVRRWLHGFCLRLIKADRFFAKEHLKILDDKRIKKNNLKRIYACTHIGGNDIQRTFEALGDHAWLFIGDPKDLYRDAAGLLLWCNGAICFETFDKEDRKIAYQRSVELLQRKGSLLIYPEGTWNTTVALPVRHLYGGTIRMAQETGAEIVPVAIEQYEDEFVVNIGQEF